MRQLSPRCEGCLAGARTPLAHQATKLRVPALPKNRTQGYTEIAGCQLLSGSGRSRPGGDVSCGLGDLLLSVRLRGTESAGMLASVSPLGKVRPASLGYSPCRPRARPSQPAARAARSRARKSPTLASFTQQVQALGPLWPSTACLSSHPYLFSFSSFVSASASILIPASSFLLP